MVIVFNHVLVSSFLFYRHPERFLISTNGCSNTTGESGNESCDHSEQDAKVNFSVTKDFRTLHIKVRDAVQHIASKSVTSVVYLIDESTGELFADRDNLIHLPRTGIIWECLEYKKARFSQNLDPEDPACSVLCFHQNNPGWKPKSVLCYPVEDTAAGKVIAVIVVSSGVEEEIDGLSLKPIADQIIGCYRNLCKGDGSSSTSSERRESTSSPSAKSDKEAIIKLCGELYDQDASALQLKVITYLEEETNAECAFLLLVVPETQELFCQVIGHKVLDQEVRFPGQTSSFAKALETKEPICLEDISLDKRKGLEEFLDTSLQSLLCVPVASKHSDNLIALACVVNKRDTENFTKADVETIKTCFQYTATVLTSTLAFENERKLKIQTQAMLQVARNLFTHLGEFTGYHCQGLNDFPEVPVGHSTVDVRGSSVDDILENKKDTTLHRVCKSLEKNKCLEFNNSARMRKRTNAVKEQIAKQAFLAMKLTGSYNNVSGNQISPEKMKGFQVRPKVKSPDNKPMRESNQFENVSPYKFRERKQGDSVKSASCIPLTVGSGDDGCFALPNKDDLNNASFQERNKFQSLKMIDKSTKNYGNTSSTFANLRRGTMGNFDSMDEMYKHPRALDDYPMVLMDGITHFRDIEETESYQFQEKNIPFKKEVHDVACGTNDNKTEMLTRTVQTVFGNSNTCADIEKEDEDLQVYASVSPYYLTVPQNVASSPGSFHTAPSEDPTVMYSLVSDDDYMDASSDLLDNNTTLISPSTRVPPKTSRSATNGVDNTDDIPEVDIDAASVPLRWSSSDPSVSKNSIDMDLNITESKPELNYAFLTGGISYTDAVEGSHLNSDARTNCLELIGVESRPMVNEYAIVFENTDNDSRHVLVLSSSSREISQTSDLSFHSGVSSRLSFQPFGSYCKLSDFENLVNIQCPSTDAVPITINDLTKLLREIMQEARNLTQAERCSVFLIDQETDELVAKVFDGITTNDNEVQSEIRMPITQGIAGHVATTGNLLNIKDAYSHPMFYRGIDDSTGFRTRNILCFPIKNETGVVLGVAQLCNKKTGPFFTTFDEDVASAFAVYCCISISHCLMYQKLQDSQHRNRLANELMIYHMQVAQEDVDNLVQCNIPSVTHWNQNFDRFHFPPRQITEDDTSTSCLTMFEDLGFIQKFRIRRDTLARFVLMVKRGYRNPPYHNWMHAFSVAHFCYVCIKNLELQKYLDETELFALFVSCLCHDIDHRGTNNSYQVASKSVLAALYSSEGSVLERHHFAQTMCIVNTEGCNIFENLSSKDYQQVLDLVRDIILATDLAHHLRILKNIESMAKDGYQKSNLKNHKLLLCLLMTASDLSDQTKPWNYAKHIAALIYNEFFSQGDLEKSLGKEPMEMMDRERARIPDLQIGFLDHIALPVYKVLSQIFDAARPVENAVEDNRRHWEKICALIKLRRGGSCEQMSYDQILALEEEADVTKKDMSNHVHPQQNGNS